jgi:MYXO-CTERM domain-containing protein
MSGARLREVARAWVGPVALAIYALTQFVGTSPDGGGGVLWAAIFGLAALAVLLRRRNVTAMQLMALEVLACAAVSDWQNSTAGALRDLNLYLHAGSQFLAGGPVYTTVPIDHYPAAGGFLPYLYAPPTLPMFALLSALPYPLVASLWVTLSVAAVVG